VICRDGRRVRTRRRAPLARARLEELNWMRVIIAKISDELGAHL